MGVTTAALAVSAVVRAAPSTPAKRPNILFLFTDDQRFDTLHALGNPNIHTPNMDRLVEQGVSFTHCFIMGSTTPAVCICSRASLITGRHLFSVPHQPQAEDGLALWPQIFREHSYTTFATGKWHNGPWSFAQSFSQGENIFFGGMSDHLTFHVHDFDPTGQYPTEHRTVGKAFSSELFSNSAVKFLREYEGSDPWFAYVSYTAPHDPRMAPPEYERLYPRERIPVPPNFLPEHPFDNGELRIRDELLAPWPRTPEIVQEHIAGYYAMISHLDHHLGRVLDALEARGEWDNTIIIFASDNGLAVGQHGLLGKQNLYEHSVRVPLVMVGPGLPRNVRSEALVYLHDLLPTTCELAGIEIPETVESTSRTSLLWGETNRGLETVFGAYMSVQRMVRDERWKLIRYPQAEITQLFDLANDPWETTNLVNEPQYADKIVELHEQLRQWQIVVGDPLELSHSH
ncbi:MAG: sulfatase-like hydrolase/transferase [Candidatus Zipacnadales bacterium]